MHKQAYELCMAIEELPASEQQTKVSVMAADLLREVERLEALLDKARSFFVGQIRGGIVLVESQGEGKWRVRCGVSVLNCNGKFEYESLPSSRNQAFCDMARFPLEEAITRATAAIKECGEQP